MDVVAWILAAALSTSCVTAGADEAWCPGTPVDFGTVKTSGLGLGVLDSSGRGVAARVRYRRDAYLVTPGSWEQSATSEEGIFGVADLPDGRYEIEVCGANARPIHGRLDVEPESPVALLTLRFSNQGQ